MRFMRLFPKTDDGLPIAIARAQAFIGSFWANVERITRSNESEIRWLRGNQALLEPHCAALSRALGEGTLDTHALAGVARGLASVRLGQRAPYEPWNEIWYRVALQAAERAEEFRARDLLMTVDACSRVG